MSERPKRILIGERVHIYPRGKKRTYCADFWCDGRHQRRSLKTRNLKIARQRALQLEAQLIEGDLKPSQAPMALEKAVEAFLERIKTENRRPKTITKYKGFFEISREFAESNNVYRLSQVTPALVDKYRAFRKADLSMTSMHNEAVMLKTLLKWAKQRRYIRQNPLAEMKFERPRLEPRGGPTRAQVEGILKKAREPRRTQYAVLAYTGMRSGELQRLRVEDVDLKGNWIHVVSREGAETKTGYSRKVPIHRKLKPFLANSPDRGRGCSRLHPAGSIRRAATGSTRSILTKTPRSSWPPPAYRPGARRAGFRSTRCGIPSRPSASTRASPSG